MNKKGISAVVATVLIILITVAAVTIIWSAVIPMIRDNLSGGDDCFKAQSDVSIGAEGYTCIEGYYNSTDGKSATYNASTYNVTKLSIQIKRGSGNFELKSIQAIVHTGGQSTSVEIGNISSMPKVNQAAVFSVNGSFAVPTKLEIAPIITVGNTKKNCGIAQSVDLAPCSA